MEINNDYKDMKVYFYDPFGNNPKSSPKKISTLISNDEKTYNKLVNSKFRMAERELTKRAARKMMGSEKTLTEYFEEIKKSVDEYNKIFFTKTGEIQELFTDNNVDVVFAELQKLGAKSKSSFKSQADKLAKLSKEHIKILEDATEKLESAILSDSYLGLLVTNKEKNESGEIKNFSMNKFKNIEKTVKMVNEICKTLQNSEKATDELESSSIKNMIKQMDSDIGKDEEEFKLSTAMNYLKGRLYSVAGFAMEMDLCNFLNSQNLLIQNASVDGADKTTVFLADGSIDKSTAKTDVRVEGLEDGSTINFSLKSHFTKIDSKGQSTETSLGNSYLTTTLKRFLSTSTQAEKRNSAIRSQRESLYYNLLLNEKETLGSLRPALLYAYGVRSLVGNNSDDIIDIYFDTHGGCHLTLDFINDYIYDSKRNPKPKRLSVNFSVKGTKNFDRNKELFNLFSNYDELKSYQGNKEDGEVVLNTEISISGRIKTSI